MHVCIGKDPGQIYDRYFLENEAISVLNKHEGVGSGNGTGEGMYGVYSIGTGGVSEEEGYTDTDSVRPSGGGGGGRLVTTGKGAVSGVQMHMRQVRLCIHTWLYTLCLHTICIKIYHVYDGNNIYTCINYLLSHRCTTPCSSTADTRRPRRSSPEKVSCIVYTY